MPADRTGRYTIIEISMFEGRPSDRILERFAHIANRLLHAPFLIAGGDLTGTGDEVK